jgi:hypothetical protein
MRTVPASLMALASMVAAEATALERMQSIRASAPRKRKASGTDRTKIKAARKQRRKQNR